VYLKYNIYEKKLKNITKSEVENYVRWCIVNNLRYSFFRSYHTSFQNFLLSTFFSMAVIILSVSIHILLWPFPTSHSIKITIFALILKTSGTSLRSINFIFSLFGTYIRFTKQFSFFYCTQPPNSSRWYMYPPSTRMLLPLSLLINFSKNYSISVVTKKNVYRPLSIIFVNYKLSRHQSISDILRIQISAREIIKTRLE